MKKTTYKKEYINGKDVKVNDTLLDTNYPFPQLGDLRMTVMDKPIFEFEQMFKIVYKDAANDDYKNEYINSLECIIRVKPYDVSKYETDENGTYYKAFEKPLCRIVKMDKMTEVQRNEFFKAYLIHCMDNSTRNMTAGRRAAMLKNLQTIHETDDIKKAFEAIRNNI